MSASTAQNWVDVLVSWKGLGMLVLAGLAWENLSAGIARIVAAARRTEDQ